MKKFFKFLYLFIVLSLSVFFTVIMLYTILNSKNSNSIISSLMGYLIMGTIFWIITLFAYGAHLEEGKFKTIMMLLIIISIMFTFIFSSIVSFKNNLSIRYELLFASTVVIVYTITCFIGYISVSMIKKACPLTTSKNYKAYYIVKASYIISPFISFIPLVIYFFNKISYNFIPCIVVWFIYFFAYIIMMTIINTLFKKALDSKIYKLFYISKGLTRTDIENELASLIDIRFGDSFEIVRPFKLIGKEVKTYQLIFNDDKFVNYSVTTYKEWYESH